MRSHRKMATHGPRRFTPTESEVHRQKRTIAEMNRTYELENQQAMWTSQEVMIRRHDTADEKPIFILTNPTERTHAFEAPSLFEQSRAPNGSPLTRPLQVTMAPGETMEIVIRFLSIEGDAEPLYQTSAVCYRFYYPLRHGKNDSVGIIHLVH